MVKRKLLALCLLLPLGCYEAPFERANPVDPDAEIEMTLASTRDTVTPSDPWVAFQLVSDPVLEGYVVTWFSSPAEAGLIHQGNGVFRLMSTPTSPIQVLVTGRIFPRSATKIVILAPDP